MNLEIIYPASSNVIDYDKQILQFHNSIRYDKNGNAVGEVKGSGRMLQGMIKQINANVQKRFNISKPNFLTVPKHQDFGKMKDKFLSRLSKLQSKFGLKDSDEVSLYHQYWWADFIQSKLKNRGFD